MKPKYFITKKHVLTAVLLLAFASGALGGSGNKASATYVLGPEDVVSIRILQAPEIAERPVRIDLNGMLELPFIGRFQAGGLTLEGLRTELVGRLKEFINEPQVSVGIEEFRSQPVSVIGAVTAPGIQQLRGPRTLVEMISMAGGVRADCGSTIRIARRLENGPIPLPGATADSSGQYSVAEVNLKSVLDSHNPGDNLVIKPNDVITVTRAELVYVLGEVARPGGFPLNERENMTVLQALSLAGGVNRTAAAGASRILRLQPGATTRTEVPLDLRKLLAGKGSDADLQPDDILFIPGSASKRASIRVLEAAIQLGTGVVIWRR